MKNVRLGVIGCGGMARQHMAYFHTIPGLSFTAAADANPKNLEEVAGDYGVAKFDDGKKLIKSGKVDAIMICTPHYFHPALSIAGLKKGLHVLTEKPVAVTAHEAEKVEKVHAKYPKLQYAAMFQLRNHPFWLKLKSMLDNGLLGEVQRVQWTVTNWFRTQAYYNAGAWRATWKGEGGGVLLNQSPHNLDLLCWLFGPPTEVTAHCSLGKYHNIEVEDDVTAYMRWQPSGKAKKRFVKGGATGTFITSTGESPGTDRLEIAGNRGRIVVEHGKIQFDRTDQSVREYSDTTDEAFGTPPAETTTIESDSHDPGHSAVTANFIEAIQTKGKTPLICPASEALHELELGNAMLYSGLTGGPVSIPMKRKKFADHLEHLIETSTYKKPKVKAAKIDLSKSFH